MKDLTLFLFCVGTTSMPTQTTTLAEVKERIRAFAGEGQLVLAMMDPERGPTSDRTGYARIATEARALADELRDFRQDVPYPTSELTTAYALADYYKTTDPEISSYYITSAIQMHTQAILAEEMPAGHGSLVDVHDLARQAVKARTNGRLIRVHERLIRRLEALERSMAER